MMCTGHDQCRLSVKLSTGSYISCRELPKNRLSLADDKRFQPVEGYLSGSWDGIFMALRDEIVGHHLSQLPLIQFQRSWVNMESLIGARDEGNSSLVSIVRY